MHRGPGRACAAGMGRRMRRPTGRRMRRPVPHPIPFPVVSAREAPATLLTCALAIAALLAGCGRAAKTSTSKPAPPPAPKTPSPAAGPVGPEGVLLGQGQPLAADSSTAPGTTVNGIQCGGSEQFVLHVHAHLAVYVNGQPVQIPAGVGLIQPSLVSGSPSFYTATQCFYWLHTHAADGIIHIESPSKTRVFTLGDFFAEWRQPLSSNQVGQATGPVTAFLNGKRWTKNPALIPLGAHAVVQLDVGTPVVPPKKVSFGNQGL